MAHWFVVPVYCHSRLSGNGLSKPLDSGLRRNDGGGDSGFWRAATGVLGGLFQTRLYRLRPIGVPSRRIQDILSINDGEGCGPDFLGPTTSSFQRKLESRIRRLK